MAELSLDLTRLRAAYRHGLTVAELTAEIMSRVDRAGEDHVWISRIPRDRVQGRAETLDRMAAADPTIVDVLPLFGVPFAVKDNIDVAGMATTAACPGFSYLAETDAPCVALLEIAGALLIGKTNLDQFATGLVGVRSPYGVPRNPFDARYIPGGSSSGSAVAVASGLVSFALGTDTAGSGRVPAAFNNLVGLKPTLGLVSTRGVVPACASLDCVSIFALTADDGRQVLDVIAEFDAAHPFSRHAQPQAATFSERFRFGVPDDKDLEFFSDSESARLYSEATKALKAMGGAPVRFSLAPFLEAARLLYEGPWVAERMAALEKNFRERPEDILPVTRAIVAGADRFSAVDAFKAQYRLAALKRETEPVWNQFDVMVLPTAPTIYRIEEIEADPIALNSGLGRYTNFVNLLDLSAIAVPVGFRGDGLPWGVTLLAPAFHDHALAALGIRFACRRDLPLGATGVRPNPPAAQTPSPAYAGGSAWGQPAEIELAVFGAHLSGMPLNHELRKRGAHLTATVTTAPHYRMFALDGGASRPGVVRVDASEGQAIEGELWSVSSETLGALLASLAPPLSIGTLELADGRWVKGFLCEAAAVSAARDITNYGGWRRYLAARK